MNACTYACLLHTSLKHGLELSSHADFLLFLPDDSLDGWREAAGVAREDQCVAILTASVLSQCTTGIGDGVVVVVCVNYPVVVT